MTEPMRRAATAAMRRHAAVRRDGGGIRQSLQYRMAQGRRVGFGFRVCGWTVRRRSRDRRGVRDWTGSRRRTGPSRQ